MPTPSITTLSQQYGHARQTCAKALRTLEEEGLLTRIPGLGYYVTGTADGGSAAKPGS
jgi:DNA-binding GntR family transcriptional regulator